MAETEVENILREIRERVISQQQDRAATSARSVATNGANGANDSAVARSEYRQNPVANLALIDSYLTTTGRAWDRLPPVVSNRSGLVARIELWLKRRLRSGTRWFTWEQVNFNAAVHHALRDLLPVLTAHEQELRKLQATIEAEVQRIEEQHTPRAEFNARLAETNARLTELNARVGGLLSEVRERDEHLQDQQRVSFKQLSLEASENAVLEDRARRKTDALLEELRLRVEQLEK